MSVASFPNTRFKKCSNKGSVFLQKKLILQIETQMSRIFTFNNDEIKRHNQILNANHYYQQQQSLQYQNQQQQQYYHINGEGGIILNSIINGNDRRLPVLLNHQPSMPLSFTSINTGTTVESVFFLEPRDRILYFEIPKIITLKTKRWYITLCNLITFGDLGEHN